MADNPPPAADTGTERLITLGAAAMLLGGFLWLSYEMIEIAKLATTDEKAWARMFSVYSGLSAIASAAAGVLLGTQVQRGNVAAARAEAETARTETQRVKDGVANVVDGLPTGGAGDEEGRFAGDALSPAVRAKLLQLSR